MAIKETMNKRDIVRFHKLLEDNISLKEISKMLLITPKTLEKFSPELVKKANQRKASIRKALLDQHKSDDKKNT